MAHGPFSFGAGSPAHNPAACLLGMARNKPGRLRDPRSGRVNSSQVICKHVFDVKCSKEDSRSELRFNQITEVLGASKSICKHVFDVKNLIGVEDESGSQSSGLARPSGCIVQVT
jgi:hypothetical protein